MSRGQLIPALIAALLEEGVVAEQIERAVGRVRALPLGRSYAPDPLHRAFAHEQTRLLGRVPARGPE